MERSPIFPRHAPWWPTTISPWEDRKSTRLNSSHLGISYAVFCLKKKIKREHQSVGGVMVAGIIATGACGDVLIIVSSPATDTIAEKIGHVLGDLNRFGALLGRAR